jgi:hypothetical protein
MVSIQIKDTGDLRRLVKQLNRTAEGAALRKELTTAMREIVKPIYQEVRASYSGGRHLRPALKKATRMWVRSSGKQAGAGVAVDGRRVHLGGKSGRIPQYYEGERPRWRHPVWGNREVWVDQSPHPSFYRITGTSEITLDRRIETAADNVFKELD